MNAVHTRRHQHFVEQTFKANRKPQIAVMKERVCLEDQFVNGKRPAGEPDEAHLHDPKQGRHRHLAKVKPETSGNIEIWINVMNVMKTPEKRDAMISNVPIVESQIHQKETDRELQRPW